MKLTLEELMVLHGLLLEIDYHFLPSGPNRRLVPVDLHLTDQGRLREIKSKIEKEIRTHLKESGNGQRKAISVSLEETG